MSAIRIAVVMCSALAFVSGCGGAEPTQALGMQLKIRVAAPDGSRRGPRVDGVRGNVQPMVLARSMAGVYAVKSCDVVVQDNEFPNAALSAKIEPHACGLS